jgi:hypothetical protein
VAAERIAGPQCFFQIHALSRPPAAERRHLQRFERSISCERIARKARHRETAAAHADAVADSDAFEVECAHCKQQLDIAASRRDRAYFANRLNNSCEHDL